MNTNKYRQLIALWAIVLIGLSGCDTTLDVNEKIAGYYTIETSFVYPYGTTDYVFLIDGDTLKNDKGYVSRTRTTGKLEAFKKGSTKASYSENITINGNQNIQFIALGDKVDTYSEDKYTTFAIKLAYMEGEDQSLYKLFFNGVEFQNQASIYIPSNLSKGTFEVQKGGEKIYSKEINILPQTTVGYIQLTPSEFLAMPEDTEPVPEAPLSKIRFFYFAQDMPDVSEIEIKLYYADLRRRVYDLMPVTIKVKEGEVSEYITVDWSTELSNGKTARKIVYDLINTVTGETIVDHATVEAEVNNSYLKKTIQLKDNGNQNIVVIYE